MCVVCVHMYTHTYIYVYVCICTHTHMHKYTCIYTHAHAYMYMHTYIHTCIYTCIYTHTHTTHTRTHIFLLNFFFRIRKMALVNMVTDIYQFCFVSYKIDRYQLPKQFCFVSYKILQNLQNSKMAPPNSAVDIYLLFAIFFTEFEKWHHPIRQLIAAAGEEELLCEPVHELITPLSRLVL